MRVGLAQINVTLGAFKENADLILEHISRAKQKHCDLVVFPELALFGYLPGDLLERKSIYDAQWKEFRRIEAKMPAGISALVGLVTDAKKKHGKPYYNSAALIQKGKKTQFFHKELLPNYDVFDDPRFFERGSDSENFFRLKGKKVLVTLCEDIWGWGQELENANYQRNPLKGLKKTGVDLVVNLSASPFSMGQRKKRFDVVKKTALHFQCPVAYTNMVGGQDEIIFDGGSFALDKKGRHLAQSVYFEEDLNVVDLEKQEGGKRNTSKDEIEHLYQALILGIRDYARITGIPKIHLGLSGGIDSALVACLAAEALGAGQVTCLAMPGPFSAPESFTLAKKLAANLKCRFLEVEIGKHYELLKKSLDQAFEVKEFGVLHENLQARLRGTILMAFANKNSSLLVSTSNKSEFATGYATLYGDMCGGLAPLGDVLKGQVYQLCEYINREYELIPKRIIERPPTAELKANQKDQDTLPPYNELDQSIQKIVVERRSAKSSQEKWLLETLHRTEFKRWQASPVLRVSPRAFGRGRRMPIAHKGLF
ncbi:MAG: NAD+ synthase [Bdellovibrionales bacterium]